MTTKLGEAVQQYDRAERLLNSDNNRHEDAGIALLQSIAASLVVIARTVSEGKVCVVDGDRE